MTAPAQRLVVHATNVGDISVTPAKLPNGKPAVLVSITIPGAQVGLLVSSIDAPILVDAIEKARTNAVTGLSVAREIQRPIHGEGLA